MHVLVTHFFFYLAPTRASVTRFCASKI